MGEQEQEQRSLSSSGSLATSGRSEGWGSGGELVSMSDLQFSRIIGEVGAWHTFAHCVRNTKHSRHALATTQTRTGGSSELTCACY